MRYFNTAGPVICDEHYCIPPLKRIDQEEVIRLIEQKKYFILQAPHQTGKTSCLLALRDYLNNTEKYRCVYISAAVAQASQDHVELAIRALLSELADQVYRGLDDDYVQTIWDQVLVRSGPYAAFGSVLAQWAEHSPLPLILLIDDIDSLIGATRLSILRQLRAGFPHRPFAFPQSVVLCGIRDSTADSGSLGMDEALVTNGAPFNINAESLRLKNFSPADIEDLYQQHTTETGQHFVEGFIDLISTLTQGQPWLVNAIGYEVCYKHKIGRNHNDTITLDMIIEVSEVLIKRREVHLEHFVDKLHEIRVKRIISPMLEGTMLNHQVSRGDIQYVIDLGLVARGLTGLQIANPIYQEIIPRELNFITQLNLESLVQPTQFIRPNGRIDLSNLLRSYQTFFRTQSQEWLARFDYQTAGVYLLFQAYLQRVVDGHGRIERRYGLGRQRTDLLVIWPFAGGLQKTVVELRLQQAPFDKTLEDGLKQTWAFMDRFDTDEGHLVICDRTENKPWLEKIFKRAEKFHGRIITVWGI